MSTSPRARSGCTSSRPSTTATRAARYAFGCPQCHEDVEKPADAEVVRLLSSAGVRVDRVPVPAEAREAHSGGPIGYDDLLDLVLWLETHDAIAEDMALTHGR